MADVKSCKSSRKPKGRGKFGYRSAECSCFTDCHFFYPARKQPFLHQRQKSQEPTKKRNPTYLSYTWTEMQPKLIQVCSTRFDTSQSPFPILNVLAGESNYFLVIRFMGHFIALRLCQELFLSAHVTGFHSKLIITSVTTGLQLSLKQGIKKSFQLVFCLHITMVKFKDLEPVIVGALSLSF